MRKSECERERVSEREREKIDKEKIKEGKERGGNKIKF